MSIDSLFLLGLKVTHHVQRNNQVRKVKVRKVQVQK